MRRVVVTGLGMVTPLASGVEETWKRLLAGESGAGPITRFDTSGVATKYACELPLGDGTNGTFNPDDWMEPKDRRKVDDFILYGMAAAEQAVKDSGWVPANEDERERTRDQATSAPRGRSPRTAGGPGGRSQGREPPLGRGPRRFRHGRGRGHRHP